MEFKKEFTERLQLIIAITAVASSVFGVFNFYLLTKLAPIERRVEAIEDWKFEINGDIKKIPTISERVDNIKDSVNDLKRHFGLKILE